MTTDKTDPLAAMQFTPLAGGSADQADPSVPAADAEADAAMRMIGAHASKLVIGLFKVARALIAKKVPEIKEEWTDEMFNDPSEAAVPLLKKYASRLMEVVSQSPELTAFAMSLVPLGFGLVNAMNKRDENPRSVTKNQGETDPFKGVELGVAG